MHRIDELDQTRNGYLSTPWLMTNFRENCFGQSSFSQRVHSQDLATKLLLLINGYIKILPRSPPDTIPPSHNHNILSPPPPTNARNLINIFQLSHSYFSIPLTCPTNSTQYYSPHDRDMIFGSLGLSFSHQWIGHGFAHVVHITLIPKAINGNN